jgi:hypothetical protein
MSSSRFLRRNVLAISAIPAAMMAVSLVELTTNDRKNNKSHSYSYAPNTKFVAYCAANNTTVIPIDKVKKAIADAIAEEDERREDGTSIGPTLVL